MRLWQALLALVAFWAAIYLPGLGQPELKGEEGRRILPGLEMIKTGEWVVPYMEGQPYLRKPPLFNWSVAASVLATGKVSEFTARLPSVLSVLLLALAAGVCLSEMIAGPAAKPGDRAKAAFVAGILVLVHAGLLEKGRLAELEAMFVSLSGVGMALWIMLWRQEAPKWLTWTLPYLWLGLAMLCKGPTHLLFFYAIVIATLKKDRSLRELLHPAHFVGLGLCWGLFALWAVPFKHRVAGIAPSLNAGQTWVEQLTSRLGFEQFDLGNWALSPFETLSMFLPWVILLVFFWRRLPAIADGLGGRDRSLVLGLRVGVLVSTVVMLLVPETRSRFVQPVTLPALLLAGLILWHGLSPRWLKNWTTTAFVLLGVLTVVGLLAPLFVPALNVNRLNTIAAVGATLGPALAVWRLWVKFRLVSQPARLALTTGLVAVMLSVINAATVIPTLRPLDNCRPVGQRITAAADGKLVAIYNAGRSPVPLHWRFYVTCPHVVIDKLSAVPAEATLLVAPFPEIEDPVFRDRVTGPLGFKGELFQVIDNNDHRFSVWTREEAPAAGSEPVSVSPKRRP